MKQYVFISMVAAAVGALNAPAQITREGRYWVQTVNGYASGTPLERLRVDTVGNVVVTGDNSGKVVYAVKLRVRARDEREAEARFREFEVKSRTQNGWVRLMVIPPQNIPEGPELTVSAPRSLQQVWVESRGGNVEAKDLDGDLQVRSAAGRIVVDRIKGKAECRTGGGDIQAGEVGGTLHCYSGAGVIRVASVGGESWLDTAGGEVFVRQATGPVHATTAGGNIRIERASSAVFTRTAAGLIEVQKADGAVTAESSAGAIQVNSANGVRCESAAGTIRLRNVGGPLRASTSAGSILAELLSGTGSLEEVVTETVFVIEPAASGARAKVTLAAACGAKVPRLATTAELLALTVP